VLVSRCFSACRRAVRAGPIRPAILGTGEGSVNRLGVWRPRRATRRRMWPWGADSSLSVHLDRWPRTGTQSGAEARQKHRSPCLLSAPRLCRARRYELLTKRASNE